MDTSRGGFFLFASHTTHSLHNLTYSALPLCYLIAFSFQRKPLHCNQRTCIRSNRATGGRARSCTFCAHIVGAVVFCVEMADVSCNRR